MIRLRPSARQDIRLIASQLEEGHLTPAISRRFLVAFEKACELLEHFPKMGVEVYAEDSRLRGMRRTSIEHFSKYLIFYRVVEADILIVRVIHGMRDLPLLLNAKQPN